MTRLGRSHATVRRIRELRHNRGQRDGERVLVAEGYHLAAEALASNASIELAVVSPAIDRSDQGTVLRERIAAAGVPLHETSDSVMESLQDARSAQPILLVVRRDDSDLASILADRSGPALVAVTHDLQDPGNLGSIPPRQPRCRPAGQEWLPPLERRWCDPG